MTPRAPVLVERILKELARNPRPRSTADLAREFLGVGVIDEELAERLLRTVLADERRLVKSTAGWMINVVRVLEAPLDGAAVAAFAPRHPAVAALAPAGGVGDPVFTVAAGGDAEARRAEERLATSLPRPVVDLAQVCRRLRGHRGAPTPLALAETIRAPHVEAETPAACAAVTAVVWERLAGEFVLEGLADIAALERLVEQRLERAEFRGKEFGPEQIEDLPAGPGVYSFLDERGRALYVGQSQCVAARVASYFAGPPRDEKDRAVRSGAVRLAARAVDSAPDALLLEARWIRRRRPRLNIRIATRSAGAEGDDGILAVRGPGEGGKFVLFVLRSGGLCARWAAAPGPRRSRRVVTLAVAALFAPAPPERPDLEAAALLETWRRTHPEALFLRPAIDGGPEQITDRLLRFANA